MTQAGSSQTRTTNRRDQKSKPDVTLHGLVAELGERGVVTSYGSVWRIVGEAGITFKKDADRPRAGSASDRQTPRAMAQVSGPDRSASARLHRRNPGLRRGKLWAKTNMTRPRGWCARGLPLADKVRHGHWRTLTFLAPLRHDRIDVPLVLDGPINGQSFTAYVEQFLLPTLSSGDIVVMDNLGSHKGKAVRQLIRSVDARLFFLPPPASAGAGSTRSISIPSRRSLPSSRRCFARPTPDRSQPHGSRSARISTPSHLTNAPTTSAITARVRHDSTASGRSSSER